jgi:hypothetical protein
MIRSFSLFILAVALTFFLGACSQADFGDCTYIGDYLSGAVTLLSTFDDYFLIMYPTIWSLIVVRKMFFV